MLAVDEVVKSLQANVQNLEREGLKKDSELQDTKEQLMAKETETLRLVQEIETLCNEGASKDDRELLEAKDQLSAKEAAHLELLGQMENLTKALSLKDEGIGSLTASIQDLESEGLKKDQELLDLRERLAAKESNHLALLKEVELLIKDLSCKDDKIASVKECNKALESEGLKKDQELQEFKSQLVAKESENQLLGDSLKMSDAARTSLAEQLEAQSKDANESYSAMNEAMERLRSEAEDLAAVKNELEKRYVHNFFPNTNA